MLAIRSLPAGILAALIAAVPAARAGAAVVLQDGRVIEGEEVRRERDLVLVVLESGEVVAFPAAIVRETRLGGGPPPPRTTAPSGLREAGPATLAGTEVEPPRTADQLAVFGAPSRLQGDVVGPGPQPSYWYPDPAQGSWAPSTWPTPPINPEWVPESAFDAERDVLADGRSEFSKSILDPTWKPTDGFKKTGTSFGGVPGAAGRTWTALSTAPPLLRTRDETIAWAFKAASAAGAAELVLLSSADDLARRSAGKPAGCSEPARARKKSRKLAAKEFAAPSFESVPDGARVRFLTWSSAGGAVVRHEAVVAAGGSVTLRQQTIVAHVGRHTDPADTSRAISRNP